MDSSINVHGSIFVQTEYEIYGYYFQVVYSNWIQKDYAYLSVFISVCPSVGRWAKKMEFQKKKEFFFKWNFQEKNKKIY